MKNSLIHIGDKAYKECDVIMLPAKESKIHLHKFDTEDRLTYSISDIESIAKFKSIPQHLYILSDEEIKEGDWFIDLKDICGPNILNCHIKGIDRKGIPHVDGLTLGRCKKIIATTDKSLKIKSEVDGVIKMITLEEELPRPSNEFLQAYVKAQGKIDKVLVEYELVKGVGTNGWFEKWVPKVAPDNTITIKPIQENLK